VRNECLDRVRRHARRQKIVPIAAAAEAERDAMLDDRRERPDDAVGRAEVRALLERKLDELPEAFRTVFVLRSVEELSVEETAECLDIPAATVRSRHARARGLLRESLAREIDMAERDVFAFGGCECDRIVASVLRRLDEH
jgi:RNA polymerase sigma-70 factor (ECF subfamily)